MNDFFANPLAGICLSIGAYLIGQAIYRKWSFPLFNPLLIASIIVILILEFTPWSMEAYQNGGKIIVMFLGPATVLLALPLYHQRAVLKQHAWIILISILMGSVTAVAGVWGMAKLLNLPDDLLLSFLPKSVTTPIAVELSDQLGGIPALTAMAVVFTGIIGAVTAPIWLKICGVKNPVAKGLGLGTSAHAIGTSKALELGDVEGAMSSLSIGIAGLMTVGIVLILGPFLG